MASQKIPHALPVVGNPCTDKLQAAATVSLERKHLQGQGKCEYTYK